MDIRTPPTSPWRPGRWGAYRPSNLSEVRLRSLVSAAALTSSILDGATGRSGSCLPGEVLGMLPGEAVFGSRSSRKNVISPAQQSDTTTVSG